MWLLFSWNNIHANNAVGIGKDKRFMVWKGLFLPVKKPLFPNRPTQSTFCWNSLFGDFYPKSPNVTQNHLCHALCCLGFKVPFLPLNYLAVSPTAAATCKILKSLLLWEGEFLECSRMKWWTSSFHATLPSRHHTDLGSSAVTFSMHTEKLTLFAICRGCGGWGGN